MKHLLWSLFLERKFFRRFLFGVKHFFFLKEKGFMHSVVPNLKKRQ